jgi:hypothetical protein
LSDSVVDGLLGEMQNRGATFLDSEFTLFEISFGNIPGLPTIPIKVSLPQQISERGKGLLADVRAGLSTALSGGGNHAVWE